MKNKILSGLLIAIVFALAVSPSSFAKAKVQEFSDSYMELTLPDDTIVLTKNTPDSDEHWATAGIANVKSEKQSMKKMGAKAIFYDPNTKSLVRLLQKQSSQTSDIFNLSLLSEKEKKDFFNSLVATKEENTKTAIEEYPQTEAIFFRYSIEMTKDTGKMTELIYGTIVNGYTFSFDIYQSTKSVPIDETFIKELVDGTHFTTFLDKAEVERQVRNEVIRSLIEFAAIIIVIVVWIIARKKKNKKQKVQKDIKAKALTGFYASKKQREEQNIKEEIRFTNHTKYTDQIIKDFCYYNRFLKRIVTWIIMAVLFLVVLVLISQSKVGFLGCIVAIILIFIFVYYQGISTEKLVDRMIKSYDKSKGTEASFTFYEDYFTASGIQYISTYPYLQITDIRQHKDFIYIYLGPEKAFYLKKDGFDKDADAFLQFMNAALKSAKAN
ncbi:YcxB family protein [Anaerocolumna xylanovorans]|uniref:YcxB-like protein n=1 Tax=Anaerocolumna xylanovorans DSM 12503 TaxID=1121345 RepID=A0A1M7YMI4_9FIRM|nr:YcxB family protein [Anaerocolumna xylanovorans]SHO53797.1 YcxB-like protein [Anaerocolumna xylanovorans DSM 12503]